ncbi:29741_t:CDS:2 [Gigaspora margarita]|uniref:29741_t:CDS:1 n=1 Tax=Gigaspora margarita TaxID=4874 RepID=A0ABN7VBH3_GIGMA|nr:29741_t:CDS:2 [Gigaspora margarita]
MEQYKDKLFYFPTLNYSTKEFECIDNSGNNSHPKTTIFGQITLFGSVAGLFFNIAVYGVTSKLDIKKTYKKAIKDENKDECFAKKFSQKRFDIIKTIFIWILFINSFLVLLYDLLEIRFGGNYKLSDKLTDSAAHINAIIDLEFLSFLTDIYLNFKTKRFNNKTFLETILDLFEKECKQDLCKWKELHENESGEKNELKENSELGEKDELKGKNNKSRKSNYDFIRAIFYDLRKKELNEKTEKLIAEKLMECGTIYVDILETGLFQYLIYSHRSYKKYQQDLDKDSLDELKDVLKISGLENVVGKVKDNERLEEPEVKDNERLEVPEVNANETSEEPKVKTNETFEEPEMEKIGKHFSGIRKLLGHSENPKWEVIYSILEFKYRERIYVLFQIYFQVRL